MAHSLALTNGTTTAMLTTAGCMLRKYAMQGPAQEGDGWADVDEEIELSAYGATTAAAQAVIRNIERLLLGAMERQQTQAGPRVYLQVGLMGEAGEWRSEVLSGEVELDPLALQAWGNAHIDFRLVVRRRFFWETAAEVALQWDGGAASVSINNGDTGARYNRATIQSVEGTLPAPITLEVTNSAGAGVAWRRMCVGNDHNVGFTGLNHMIQSGSVQSWGSGGVNHGSLLFVLALSTTQISLAKGRFFRITAAFTAASTNVHLRAGVYASIGGVYEPLALGNEVLNMSGGAALRLVDLGALPIPPGGEGTATTALAIIVTARAAGSGNLTLDFVQLAPADGFRRLEQIGYTTANGDSVVDDGVEGTVYYLTAANHRYNIVRGLGGPLMVWPGRLNRIMVLYDEGSAYTPGRAMSISGVYRPRRATI